MATARYTARATKGSNDPHRPLDRHRTAGPLNADDTKKRVM